MPHFDSKTNNVIQDILITEDQVFKKLEKLKVNKSPGPDGIHPKVLFELKEVITIPLTIRFNQSIKEHCLPQVWKDAHISAILKKGLKRKPNNYRPVSLTSLA